MIRRNGTLLTCNFIWPQQQSCKSVISYMVGKFNSVSRFLQSKCSSKPKKYNKRQTKILEYIKTFNANLEQNIPQQYVTIDGKATDLYLINAETAQQFTSLIKDDLLKNASHVIELNPGMGLLTEELLKIGVPYVHLYEGQVEFFDTLNKLYDKYPDRFSLNKGNLFHLSKTMHVNYRSYGYDDTDDLLINVQRNEWNKESCMQLVGSTSRPMFVNHLILSTVFRTCLMSKGRPTFYIAILPSMWSKMTKRNLSSVRPNYIMFQTIFNYHVFGKLDRKAFIPWNRSMTKKDLMKPETMCNIDTEDISFLYLVKMEPKQEIPVVLNGKEDLFYFWHFVRQNFYKPSNRIIPTLERVIPGCGVRLIAKDYNVFTMFNDLDIKQIQDLFLEFRSWPEFEASAFTSSADQTKLWFSNYLEE